MAAVDMDELAQAARAVAGRVAAMVRDLPDTDIPIPRSEWTVGEAAAHLSYANLGMAMMARGLAIPHGDGTQAGLAEANDAALEGDPLRDGPGLAARLVEGARLFFEEVAAQPPGSMCPTPMGEMEIGIFSSYLLMHQLMHGCAIASALGEPYPFEARHLGLVWPFVQYVLPLLVNERAGGLDACVELRLRDGSFGFALMFDGGGLTAARAPTRPVDCTLTADPLPGFLTLVRILPLEAAVADGSVTMSGPRPDLGLRLPELFDMP
ncbi:MAG: maleylpyruvate isomerase N-terminal domain-containing protein [Actinomycetota bacterium]